LIPLDKSFVTDEFKKYESDIIYQLTLENKTAYIYILLEFQSHPDKTIPIRMLNYISLLGTKIYEKSQKGNLTNIFPILLYTGCEEWDVPLNVKDIFDKNIPSKYIPSFEYFLVSERDISDETLLKLRNLIAAVIYLENRRDESELEQAIDQVVYLIKKENMIDIKTFAVWFRNMFDQNASLEDVEKINSLAEVKSMLTLMAEKIEERGIEQGIEQGKLEDARNMLRKGF
jgi:predicted transposase/invertase (TIGR01784 family)